ncbi:MAG: hypothetical protein ETSY1_43410 [Candidatus Entotheonella factor]|uniref:Uncharacterized protein n=1 Tax=Entotheonella factor TaxID=1429438 RepID=W4L483_ENTF1|nr:MAG: hypothetical protein ETSY1_43410 [Candidatus Entotheonella factor]
MPIVKKVATFSLEYGALSHGALITKEAASKLLKI